MTVIHNGKEAAGRCVHLQESNSNVEDGEWEISGHDVLGPVPANMVARDTCRVEGVGQGVVVILTLTTQCSISVERLAHELVEFGSICW